MNKFIKSLIIAILALGFYVGTVFAIDTLVTISDLPEYTRTNNFQLSYSALANNPSTITARFYVRKEGESYVQFGPTLTGASGEVQVTSSEVDEQKKFYFKVEIVSSDGSATDETSVIYDISGPSPVQNYWKERIFPETYRLHWKNPGDDDFSRVFIYRGDEPDFSADGSHKIAEVGGAPDDEISWDNIGLTAGEEYYYALRAVDEAGNSSSLVGDGGGTVTEEAVVTEGEGETGSDLVILPREQGTGGEVLGEEANGEDEDVSLGMEEEGGTFQESLNGAVDTLTGSTVTKVVIVVFGVGVILYFISRRRKK
ncbi:MAG: fibronectin type III domain-containing protein [Patescibacteria group bacterium]